MLALKRSTIWTISGSAIIGAVYGLVATLRLNADGLTFWDVMIPVAAGAALCAIVTSAFSRMFQMGQLMYEGQNRHSDNSLCYRGTPVSVPISKSVLKRKSRNVAINGTLCYRGLTNTSPVSNGEIENQPVEVNLCYRGTRYMKTRNVLGQPTVSRQVAVRLNRPATKLASS